MEGSVGIKKEGWEGGTEIERGRMEESGSEDERRGHREKGAGGRKKRHRVNDEGI